MFKNLIGGLAGAIALNLVHQMAKKLDPDAPQMDKIGEEVLSKTILAAGYAPPAGKALFQAALASDLVANALYYSLIGHGSKTLLLLKGAILGAAAGIGALKLTKPLGLDDTPVNKTTKSRVMTVGLYLIGGLVAASTIGALGKDE